MLRSAQKYIWAGSHSSAFSRHVLNMIPIMARWVSAVAELMIALTKVSQSVSTRCTCAQPHLFAGAHGRMRRIPRCANDEGDQPGWFDGEDVQRSRLTVLQVPRVSAHLLPLLDFTLFVCFRRFLSLSSRPLVPVIWFCPPLMLDPTKL